MKKEAALNNNNNTEDDAHADKEQAAFKDFMQDKEQLANKVEQLAASLEDVKNSLLTTSDTINKKLDCIVNELRALNQSKDHLGQATSEISKIAPAIPISPDPSIVIPPHAFPSFIENVHPSTRNHSDSRITPRSNCTSSTKNSQPSRVHSKCVFCQSISHFSRNCKEVLSLSKRLDIMSTTDRCYRCFRTLNDNHYNNCKPDFCSRRCCDDNSRLDRHMDWFCPQNPELQE